jgi:hypothetical protein
MKKGGRIQRYKMDQRNKQDEEKKSRWVHGCLSLLSVLCCQVETSDTSFRGVPPSVVCLSMIKCNNDSLHVQ